MYKNIYKIKDEFLKLKNLSSISESDNLNTRNSDYYLRNVVSKKVMEFFSSLIKDISKFSFQSQKFKNIILTLQANTSIYFAI